MPVDHANAQERHDDSTLRAIFDSSAAWKEFARSAAQSKRVGLFGNAYLTKPSGFEEFTQASLARAQRIVAKVARASTVDEYRAIVRDLDQLSDVLCRVIDLSDFVRTNPPDWRTQQAAATAWATTYQYMNQLNTATVLHDQLQVAIERPEVADSWSEEERTVAEMLRLDFSKSAVDLPQAERDRFVDLSQRISEVGSQFVDTMAPARPYVDLSSTAARGLEPMVARRLMTASGRTLRVPTASAEAALALRSVGDEDARRALYGASRTAAPHTVRLLEQLVQRRAELAQLAGFDSFSQMALRDRMMARSPESVRRFLLALARNNAPRVQRELADLAAMGAADVKDAAAPWNRDYCMRAVRQAEDAVAAVSRQKELAGEPLSHYFSLGTVMQGLSRLLGRLYGLRLVPRATPPGETWHPDVRRLDVVSDTEGHVAVLYCDLFQRDDKAPNPAHFTVRCSRAIAPAEIAEAESMGLLQGVVASPEHAANDGMDIATAADGSTMQLPTIALVCGFTRSGGGSGGRGLFGRRGGDEPALLSFHEVETLFHEMGHAVHSVLARTSLQTVAGTRCATDLAELPSTLMEHFAADASVLALFARHYQTDAPLDYRLVAHGLRRARRFGGLDDENQIVLAMLDQAYHTLRPEDAPVDSTRIFHDLQRAAAVAPADPDDTCWQGFFGHLFGYGATYYSYLFDRVLAERVWRHVFAAGRDGAALRRDHGEHLRQSLLRWGGARDPWHCLADTLRDDRLARGDEDAMAIVGSWGTRHRFQGDESA